MSYTKRKVLRIFIGGTTPYADNRGVAATFRGTLEFLRRTFHNYKLQLYVWHTFPESLERYRESMATTVFAFNDNVKVEVVCLNTPRWFKKIQILGNTFVLFRLILTMIFFRILRTFNVNLSPRIDVLDKILIADFIIELNFGDVLTDIYYGRIVWLFNILRVTLLRFSQKPLYMFPQSIGPFKSTFSKALARIMLRGAKFVAVREQYSLAYTKGIGIEESKIRFVPDTSFLSPSVSADDAMQILNSEGFSRKCGGALIGIVLSPLVLRFTDARKRIIILRELANTIDCLIEELGFFVVFIPHVTTFNARYFDCRMLSSLLMRMLRNKDRAIVLAKEHTVEELWGVMALCSSIISMLTHPVIASLKLGVPVAAIVYSHKTEGIMKIFGLERYVLHYDDLNNNSLLKIVNELREHDNIIRQQLKDRMRDINMLLTSFQQEFSQDVENLLYKKMVL